VRTSDDRLWYLGIGPIAAILLGAALIPVRELTTASNLAFAFLALTIVAGEAGGRWAATATALASALSLNFFLTRPYLTLTIHGRDDLIAFLGLTACGLISATLGSGRAEHMAKRRQPRCCMRHFELGGRTRSRLQELLESPDRVVAAIALRDEPVGWRALAIGRASPASHWRH
jgi:K+-sensing histidine kinase KdpD